MHGKFADVKVDEDTKVLGREVITIASHEALHEKWWWDGIMGESLVFVSGDVSELNDSALEELVRKSTLVDPDSQITIKRGDSGYVYVNFNFRA